MAHDLKAHSPSWRAAMAAMAGRAYSQDPSLHMSEQGENRQGVGLPNPQGPPPARLHLLKDSYFFKTVSPAENQVFKMSPWGKLSTCKWKHLVKPSLV